jgi:hypothetical protein
MKHVSFTVNDFVIADCLPPCAVGAGRHGDDGSATELQHLHHFHVRLRVSKTSRKPTQTVSQALTLI